MRFFLDTEFIESGPRMPIQLISVGIVAEDGREYYGVSSEFKEEDANQWVRENVLPHIGFGRRVDLATMSKEIIAFVWPNGERTKPEFWGYYADYDWVVFCQIFGSMIDLPRGFPMYCRDVKQLCDDRGNPRLPKQQSFEHNALNDARWNREMWMLLQKASAVSLCH